MESFPNIRLPIPDRSTHILITEFQKNGAHQTEVHPFETCCDKRAGLAVWCEMIYFLKVEELPFRVSSFFVIHAYPDHPMIRAIQQEIESEMFACKHWALNVGS